MGINITDNDHSDIDKDEFPNLTSLTSLTLDYDEQLIEITNQDIQFAFKKFVNSNDINSLIDLIQTINKNTK
jgi:hypothetical protein